MKRDIFTELAAAQLREARMHRRAALLSELYGFPRNAELEHGIAKRCLQTAALFMKDAHAEHDVLHLRRMDLGKVETRMHAADQTGPE